MKFFVILNHNVLIQFPLIEQRQNLILNINLRYLSILLVATSLVVGEYIRKKKKNYIGQLKFLNFKNGALILGNCIAIN